MLYDYGGFPPESYSLQYPAPGHPHLAERIAGMLQSAGIKAAKDSRRGFDHGTFIPLMLMFPEADIPVVQMSVLSSQDPKAHIEVRGLLACPVAGIWRVCGPCCCCVAGASACS